MVNAPPGEPWLQTSGALKTKTGRDTLKGKPPGDFRSATMRHYTTDLSRLAEQVRVCDVYHKFSKVFTGIRISIKHCVAQAVRHFVAR